MAMAMAMAHYVLQGFLLPLLLLIAALLNWSLISLINLLCFLVVQYTNSGGFSTRRHAFVAWFIVIFSVISVLSEAIFHVIWAIEGEEWSLPDAWRAKLIGFMRARSMIFPLAMQLLVAFITLISIYSYRFDLKSWKLSCWDHFSSSVEQLGSHLRVLCCLLLPVVELVVGISHPSFISLPFFICSCIGLVDWSLTSNISGLFRWRKPLLMYASFYIVVLYAYQLPVQFPYMLQATAEIIGLYKVSAVLEWPQICCGLSLLLFYIMLSTVRSDLEDMEFILSMKKSNLADQLLPLKHSFFVRESRSGIKHTNVLLRGAVFRTFSINFFTYGFPVSLFALSYWSLCFTSVFGLALLGYVGYILYAFPSLFHWHRLNGLLLIIILFWCFGTYVFNVMFTIFNKQTEKDIEIWETLGFWHYPIPGLYLLAQFCLGILVAVGNLVNDSVHMYQPNQDGPSCNGEYIAKDEEGAKVLIIATIAWGLRKSSRAITLTLIFLIAMKPGLIHAIYMVFFMVFLLSHTLSEKMLQSLILLCEVHFALLHILELDLVSRALEGKSSYTNEILAQIGFQDHASSLEFLQIVALLCFCAVYNHGFKLLSSFSAIVQHTPYSPVGFSIWRAGLDKSLLLSVYTSTEVKKNRLVHSPHERRIATYISVIGDAFLSSYRLCGTYVAFLTILVTVYRVKPNYISFGYLFFLLLWISGRQFIDRTRRCLWFPLKVYAALVFLFTYSLSNFASFRTWLSGMINLYHNLGYDQEASFLRNVGESLAVMIVMQLYSYERRKSKYRTSKDLDPSKSGVLNFMRRILIWHSEKLLSVAVFYASLSPVGASGFVYLLGLVICSTLPKASRVPSKVFLFYTGLLVIGEYIYQMWGDHFGMFPGQSHASLSLVLGLQVYNPGFWGLESGLRGKVLVIFACTLRYHTFHWLEKIPNDIVNRGKWEESCPLFVSAGDKLHSNSVFMGRSKPSETSSLLKQRDGTSNTRPSFDSFISQGSESVSNETQGSKSSGHDGNPVDDIWGSPKENHKWNKQRVSSLKRERFDLQKNALKVCLKFWMENMFRIFGLEINMIALLLASFVSLNAISLVYIAFLACCILLGRRILRKLWFIFVFSFASILFLEYFSLWRHQTPLNQHIPKDTKLCCHDCWGNSFFHSNYCKNCWLGFIIDDSQMLVSHFIVFMLACFKLRADHLDSFSESHTYRQMMSQRRNAFWTDLSFETKSMWTMFDYLRLYCYCHLLDIVIILILITGTLEYDILHIGYLGCALVFFRIRLQILKKRNKIFKYLRMYNFTLIVLSVAYQSPYLGNDNGGKCGKYDYIYEMIGFYKYDYGFRITSRSAFVEIIIFMLVSLQSSMFSSQDFDYVSRYLEAEQIGAIAREQEKKAAWKTAQLLHIRKSEDLKYQRNLQVEKIRSEMVNLQVQLSGMKSTVIGNRSQEAESLRRRRRASLDLVGRISIPDKKIENDLFSAFEMHGSPTSENTSPSSVESLRYTSNSLHEITEVIDKSPDGEITDSDRNQKELGKQKKQSLLVSAVRWIKDGVSQLQSIGNQGVSNLVCFLNLSQKDLQVDEHPSTEIGINNERDGQKRNSGRVDRMSSVHSGNGMIVSESAILQIGRICSYMIQSNNDVVCYCCFVLIFLWNFSLLSMVYLAALFLYALCVYTGPSYMFWVIMLIYTEVYILLQYLYQIIIHHYVLDIHWELLHELGFPNHKITSSFVISSWPLFLVYLFTLLQNSITAADGEWDSLTQFEFFKGRHHYLEAIVGIRSWKEWIWKRLSLTTNFTKDVLKSFHWYWKSLTQGAESPPHFLQLSMEVKMWPEDGIQPERIESGINKLLNIGCDRTDKDTNPSLGSSAYRVRVQSIKRSQENLNLVLVVFEVVCAFPPPESPRTEWFKSLTPAADAAKEILEAQSAGVDGEIGFPYPILSVIGGGRREIDLYAYIFGADLTIFFLVAIFYHSIMKKSDQLLEVYQFDEQFPKEFVFILMVLFFLIVLDRIIYLCSFATGKVLFYLFNLVLFTYSVTKYAWNMEPSQKHAGALALRAIYLAKATSLALQAIQIRYGIPHKSTLYRQFLTSKVSRINFLGFKLYRVIPFLYELRCLLDWSCTLTSLTMYDWLKLEDIHSSLYLVKCDADLNRATHQHGQKQTNTTKCCNGICLFFILICVIWAPMLMYSSGNPTNIANPIIDANVQIDIKSAGGRLTLYQTTLCQIISLADFHKRTGVILDPQGYLDAYNIHDTQLICCQSGASVLWTVPPAIQARFATSIDADTSIVFSWVLTRARPKDKEVVKYEIVANPSNPLEVQAVFNGSTNGFRIYEFYPRYFRVTGSGDIRLLEQTVENVSGELVMSRGNKEWWSFHDTNASDASGCGGPMAIVVSEETPQGILGETLSKFSIWGLYISFVLAVGRFIRLQCSDLRMKVPFENLPSCDRLIAICEDIYAARAEGELEIEEVLYWTLIKIYRSPRMLLEYTKSD